MEGRVVLKGYRRHTTISIWVQESSIKAAGHSFSGCEEFKDVKSQDIDNSKFLFGLKTERMRMRVTYESDVCAYIKDALSHLQICNV